RQPRDSVPVKVESTKQEEQHRCGNPQCQNPFAAVWAEQKAAKSEARGHDSDPGYQDVPIRECEISGDRNAPRRVQQYPDPVEPPKRSWIYGIEQIVSGDHAQSKHSDPTQ